MVECVTIPNGIRGLNSFICLCYRFETITEIEIERERARESKMLTEWEYPLKTLRKSFTHNFPCSSFHLHLYWKSAVNSNCSGRWSYDNKFIQCRILKRKHFSLFHFLVEFYETAEQDDRQAQTGQKWKLPPNGQPICSFSGNEKQSRTPIRPEDDSKYRICLVLSSTKSTNIFIIIFNHHFAAVPI